MKIAIFLIATIVLLFSHKIISQSIPLDVISTSGETFHNGNLELEWTLGELVVAHLSNDSISVSVGLNQPGIFVTSLTESSNSILVINVYPNPTSEILTIGVYSELSVNFKAILFDVNGRKLWEESALDRQITKDLSTLNNGLYYLKIYNEKKLNYQIHKIIKTN